MTSCHSIKDGGEIRLRIESIELCRFDEGIYRCRSLPTAIGTQEQKVFTRYGNTPQQTLGQLLSILSRPSSRYRVRASQRLSAY